MDRLEDIILRLAQQAAPQTLRAWNASDPQRMARLARVLASYNVLVLVGDFPQSLRSVSQDMGTEVQQWVDGYGQLYLLLARSLFPSFTGIRAQYVDDHWPVVVTIKGDAAPVIEALAGYVSPYVAARQNAPVVSEPELIGLMEVVLDALEATTLPFDAYRRLVNDGALLIRRLLASSIRQLPLTNFDRQIFSDSQKITPLPPEPPVLPEEDSALLLGQDTRVDVTSLKPEQAAFTPSDTQTLTNTQPVNRSGSTTPPDKLDASAPPFFVPRRGETKRRPPVPRLPDDDD
ncbi:MAG: hypothetical protein HZC41_23555 [Chloroflexi bacterium]|nr:hypothetical protein [Chloroflexota bacterium]